MEKRSLFRYRAPHRSPPHLGLAPSQSPLQDDWWSHYQLLPLATTSAVPDTSAGNSLVTGMPVTHDSVESGPGEELEWDSLGTAQSLGTPAQDAKHTGPRLQKFPCYWKKPKKGIGNLHLLKNETWAHYQWQLGLFQLLLCRSPRTLFSQFPSLLCSCQIGPMTSMSTGLEVPVVPPCPVVLAAPPCSAVHKEPTCSSPSSCPACPSMPFSPGPAIFSLSSCSHPDSQRPASVPFSIPASPISWRHLILLTVQCLQVPQIHRCQGAIKNPQSNLTLLPQALPSPPVCLWFPPWYHSFLSSC